MKKVTVIGSGFSGLSCAAYLAKNGCDVTVIEKNDNCGGRARQFTHNGFKFDMGPSWFWMKDVFDKFFNDFNKKSTDFFETVKLDPGFQIIFKDNLLKLPSNWEDIIDLFESYEKGSSVNLKKFMIEAEAKYDIGINTLVQKPGLSIFELLDLKVINNLSKLKLFTSYRSLVHKSFKNKYLRSLLEFPVLFLGTAPKDTPSIYSLMAYSGIKEGTFYTMGGFVSVINAMKTICDDLGVKFKFNFDVENVEIKNNKIVSVSSSNSKFSTETVICSADYNFFEQKILPKKYQSYTNRYWQSRTMSPSSLLFYLGVSKKIKNLEHHNLFFDEDIEEHIDDIYKKPIWPKKPLFYVCCPSKTDIEVAPIDKENIFILIPIAPGIEDTSGIRKKYYDIVLDRLSKYCLIDLKQIIEYKRSYCINDFISDYNAFKGNAYGLANTLTQTANLKPKIKSKKLNNLFYTGQLTVPGPGVPPSLISGKVVANYILNKELC